MDQQVQEVKNLSNENKLLDDKLKSFEKLSVKANGWAGLLENISEVMPNNIWLTHFSIGNNKFIFEGQSDKLSTLGTFMEGLRTIKPFKSVILTSASESLDGVIFTLSIERGEW